MHGAKARLFDAHVPVVRSYDKCMRTERMGSNETQYLSKAVHSFTHETQVKRRAKDGGETQATLRDMCRLKCVKLLDQRRGLVAYMCLECAATHEFSAE